MKKSELKQLIKESIRQILTEEKKQIKKYSEVKVGDTAYENPDAGGQWDSEEGIIVFKGTIEQIKKSKYKNAFDVDVNDDDFEESYPKDYDWVVVEVEDPYNDHIIFNYDCDPSGVVVFK